MNAVRTHYTSQHPEDPEYKREMIAAFDHCHGQGVSLLIECIDFVII